MCVCICEGEETQHEIEEAWKSEKERDGVSGRVRSKH